MTVFDMISHPKIERIVRQLSQNPVCFGVVWPPVQIVIGKDTRLVLPELIVRIEGSGNYSWIYTRNGERYLISKTLSTVSALLPNFWRVHKSYLVNPAYVVGSIASVRNRAVLRLSTDETVVVARRHKKDVCSRLQALIINS